MEGSRPAMATGIFFNHWGTIMTIPKVLQAIHVEDSI